MLEIRIFNIGATTEHFAHVVSQNTLLYVHLLRSPTFIFQYALLVKKSIKKNLK